MDDWKLLAACRDMNDDTFFPDDSTPNGYGEARKYCARCPVVLQCVTYALDNNITHGMYGGLTPKQRDTMLIEGTLTSDFGPGHGDKAGTTAGYYRERAAGIEPCLACRLAFNAARAKQKKRDLERVSA